MCPLARTERTTAADVSTPEDDAVTITRETALALDRHREAVTIGKVEPGFDIATLSDEEFERTLKLEKKRQERVKAVILNDLEEGLDYGTVPGVPKPFAWEGSGDKIARRFRWTVRLMSEAQVVANADMVMATVEVGVFDTAGRTIHTVVRNCSSTEKRFKNKKTGKWKFDDAREVVNECISMAFKRGKVAAVLSAAGAKGYFAAPELLEPADDHVDEEKNTWTPEERSMLFTMAHEAGITNSTAFGWFVDEVLHQNFVRTGVDVEKLVQALEAKLTDQGD